MPGVLGRAVRLLRRGRRETRLPTMPRWRPVQQQCENRVRPGHVFTGRSLSVHPAKNVHQELQNISRQQGQSTHVPALWQWHGPEHSFQSSQHRLPPGLRGLPGLPDLRPDTHPDTQPTPPQTRPDTPPPGRSRARAQPYTRGGRCQRPGSERGHGTTRRRSSAAVVAATAHGSAIRSPR